MAKTLSIPSEAFNGTIKVRSVGYTTNTDGTVSTTPVDRIAAVPASIQPTSGSKIFTNGHPAIETTHAILVDDVLAVVNGDVLTDDDGNSYEYLYSENPKSTGTSYFCMYCRRIVNV